MASREQTQDESDTQVSIKYIRFRESISIGGEFGAIDSWSSDKHGQAIPVDDKGNWLVLWLTKPHDGERGRTYEKTGEVRRVPITSVSYIAETIDGKDPKK